MFAKEKRNWAGKTCYRAYYHVKPHANVTLDHYLHNASIGMSSDAKAESRGGDRESTSQHDSSGEAMAEQGAIAGDVEARWKANKKRWRRRHTTNQIDR
ncbi:hypothetical protein GW17_00027575 [Ensete ventricosum]|nr:hypothetical protein GW17_00027575 [Ensete ventricosum]